MRKKYRYTPGSPNGRVYPIVSEWAGRALLPCSSIPESDRLHSGSINDGRGTSMHRRVVSLALVTLVVAPASAGEFNDILNVGDAAPAWVDLPGVDGRKHSLADLKDKQVVVVVFTC